MALINGTPFDDILQGSSDTDYISGFAGFDDLYGFGGNDTLVGGAGDDDIYGGSGLDWAVFAGGVDEYQVSVFADRIIVGDIAFNGGIDYLVDVERIQFDDLGTAFDLYGNAGSAARLVGVLFDGPTVYNPAYMRIFIDAFDDGYSAEQIAAAAIDIVYPTFTNRNIAELIYLNVVDRSGTFSEIAELTSYIDFYGDDVITAYVGDLQVNEANINFSGLLQTGVDFLPII